MVWVLKKNKFLAGVSVDGTEALHNLYRHEKNGGDTYQKVRKSIALFEKYQIEYNILTVVKRQTAGNIKEIYREYKRNGWKYQQYITCLDPTGELHGQRTYLLTRIFFVKLFTMCFLIE